MTLHWFVHSIGAFAAALCVHAIACRLPIQANRVMMFLAVGIVVGTLLAWFTIARYGLLTSETAATLLVYAFTCELYIFLFTMTIGSISANLLIRLSAGDKRLADMLRDYNSMSMVSQRLDRLVDNGFLEPREDLFSLTRKGTCLLKAFHMLRRFFRHS